MAEEFIDFYELMQISPNAEAETVQRVYRMLAARYHPDNTQTGDPDKFVKLNSAYRILSNPDSRATYDLEYQTRNHLPISIFELKEFAAGIDGEEHRRLGILCLLYRARRTDPDHPGLSILELETTMSCPREHLMFAIWYLKEHDLVRQDESSSFVVTGNGVDYVEKHLPSHHSLNKLLRSAERGDVPRSERPDWATTPAPAADPSGTAVSYQSRGGKNS
jgi:curved DNA-binding protein CbpA